MTETNEKLQSPTKKYKIQRRTQNQWEKNDTLLSRENNLNDSRFLITNYWGWKEEARHFLSVKRTLIPEFYIQQQNKYPSRNEGWSSLVAQWLGLCASLQGAQVWSWVRELRSPMLCGHGPKKRQKKKREKQENQDTVRIRKTKSCYYQTYFKRMVKENT